MSTGPSEGCFFAEASQEVLQELMRVAVLCSLWGRVGSVSSHRCHLWTLGQYSFPCCALNQGIHFIFCAEHPIFVTPSALGAGFHGVSPSHPALCMFSSKRMLCTKINFAHREETMSRNCFKCWETPDLKLRDLWICYRKFWQLISSITEGFSSLSVSPFGCSS